MAIRTSDQISIVDVTDAYAVILTSGSYTFPGTINAAKAGQCTTQIIAYRGSEQIAASVDIAAITAPTGITVTKDNNTTSPTLTIKASTSFTTAGVVKIPVVLEGGITINREFAVAIAFTGETGATGNGVKSTAITYQAGTSNTTPPTGSWSANPPAVSAGQYLWTKMVITYTNNSQSDPIYSVAKQGETGATGNGVKSTSITYQTGTSNTTPPTGSWVSAPPAVDAGKYLWTKIVITYTDNTQSDPVYSVARQGEDAITMSITSSEGTIFKNSAIVTTLTAHVYVAGAEVTGAALSALGTIRWYMDGDSEAIAEGQTLEIEAGEVSNKATFIAQLES